MTDRAPAPGEVPMACPFVAFADDRARRSTVADHRHRCHAEVPPAPRALAHQETYCLTGNFPACPTFQDWARREAARSSSGDGRREVAAGRPEDALAFVAEPGDDRAGRGQSSPAGSGQPATSQQLGAFDAEGEPPVDVSGDEELAALVGRGSTGTIGGAGAGRGEPGKDDAVAWQAGDPGELPPFLAERGGRSSGPPSGPSDAEAAWNPTAGVGAGRGPGRSRAADRSSEPAADRAAPPWEPPRRFEAYPNIRTRSRLEGAGRPPTLAIGVVALAIAALILFLLPGFLGGGSSGGSPTPTAASSAVASLSPTPVPASPSPTAAVYVVKAGDTLSAIARRFGLTIEELQTANPQIKNPDRIAIGDEINIPTPAPSGGASESAGASASAGASETTAP